MGRIAQISKNIAIPEQEKKNLRITQWKMLRIPADYSWKGIHIVVGMSTFFIHNITLDQFNQINYKNSTEPFKYEYVSSALICNKCYGRGIVDWVSKVTTRRSYLKMTDLKASNKYVRNKKGPITKITNIQGDVAYKSTPKLRVGEEFCPSCDGCTIRTTEMLKDMKTVFFDKC